MTSSLRVRQSAATVSGSWVGTVKGTDAFVAVVVFAKATGGKHAVLAYVCDSKKIAEWFRGSTSDGGFSLTSSGGYRLAVTVTTSKEGSQPRTLLLVSDSALAASYRLIATQPHQWVFVRLRGVTETHGSIYGGSHHLLVQQILEIRPVRRGECQRVVAPVPL